MDKIRRFYKTAFACDDSQIPVRFSIRVEPWLILFEKIEAVNPAQEESFVSEILRSRLGTDELLRPTTGKIIDAACDDYQQARYRRMPFRNGNLGGGDPTNLVFEFIKETCVNISNLNPHDFSTVIKKGGVIYNMIQFLKKVGGRCSCSIGSHSSLS